MVPARCSLNHLTVGVVSFRIMWQKHFKTIPFVVPLISMSLYFAQRSVSTCVCTWLRGWWSLIFIFPTCLAPCVGRAFNIVVWMSKRNASGKKMWLICAVQVETITDILLARFACISVTYYSFVWSGLRLMVRHVVGFYGSIAVWGMCRKDMCVHIQWYIHNVCLMHGTTITAVGLKRERANEYLYDDVAVACVEPEWWTLWLPSRFQGMTWRGAHLRLSGELGVSASLVDGKRP